MEKTENELQMLTGQEQLSERQQTLEKWKEDVLKTANGAKRRTKASKGGNSTQKRFVLKQKIAEAEFLHTYINASSAGLSTLVGSSQLFKLAKEKCDEVGNLQKELDVLEEEYHSEGEGKAQLVTSTAELIQKEIEAAVNKMQERHHSLSRLADGSQRRSKIWSKLGTDKEKLQALLQKLHHVELEGDGDASLCDLDNIIAGHFPWHVKASSSWSVKKQATDAFMLQQRLQEEEAILTAEMKNLLTFYLQLRDALLAETKDLNREHAEYLAKDKDDLVGTSGDPDNLRTQYMIRKEDRTASVIKGLLNIKRTGITETKARIEWALGCFKKAVTGNGWKTMVLDHVEDDEEDEDDDIDDDGFEPF
ncbi:uncharacterized protein [Amphiura filiformis]|uniref:uncharacterized protein n=1 Tax=Amphiura filiformis TaxID=82378 RepID=UPI003B20C429